MRSLLTNAVAPVIASRVHWTSGRTGCLARRRRGRADNWMRGAGEVEQVSPFGVVELKRPSREYHEVGGAYVKDGEICGALGIRVTDGSQLDDTLDTAAAHPDRR